MRAVLIALVCAGLTAVPAVALGHPARAKVHHCGRIDIIFPGGEGGASAVDIRARHISCRPARKVARACMRGHVTAGWHAKFVGERQVLTSGRRRIDYLAAGGGGCGF